MKSSEQYTPSLSFGLLLLGPPKAGKSSVAMKFPAPYFADCDNNLASAMRQNPGAKFFYDVINIKENADGTTTPVPETERWERLTRCLDEAIKNPEVKTIVVDSLSLVADYLIAAITKGRGNSKGPEMQIQDWGVLKNKMTQFITWLRSSGKLIIFTAHEKYDKDEMSGILMYRINFPGSLADNIGAFFSDVWRCEVEHDAIKQTYRYIIRTMPTNKMSLGNSLGLPATTEFSWGLLEEKLKGHTK